MTNYTLSSTLTIISSSFWLLWATPVVAQDYHAPVNEYGQPNLRGVWNFSAQTPLERPTQLGEREFLSEAEQQQTRQRREQSQQRGRESEQGLAERLLQQGSARSTGAVNRFWMESSELNQNPRTSLIVHPSNGRIPEVQSHIIVQRSDQSGITEIPGERPVRYTHGGIARNGPEDRGLSERCLVFNSGPPLLSGPYNNNIQIFQNRTHVVILTEMGFDARIVPLQAGNEISGHIHEDITLWSGDSKGYFEGDTLVVETRNFTQKIASLGMRDRAYGDASKRLLIERFTPTSGSTMDYEFTIEDSNTFKDTLRVIMPMTKVDSLIYEYSCHPGNYAMTNILRGARIEEALP